MRVRDLMSHHVVTIDGDRADLLIDYLWSQQIVPQVPVRRDSHEAALAAHHRQMSHADPMHPRDRLEARVRLPMVQGGRVIGMLTETDLLCQICRADAACAPGIAEIVVSYP